MDKSNKIDQLFEEDLKVINMGLDNFGTNLEEQGYQVVQVDWSPPAGGDEEMADLLDLLDD